MSDIELDYHYLTNEALKGVVRKVLDITHELGAAPGEHHFYIEFLTDAPGVSIPEKLSEAYPERMTIVLQHQFKDLAVTENGFSVTLWFQGEPSVLRIPFEAVTSFADPSVQFGLRFDAAGDPDEIPEELPEDQRQNSNSAAAGDASTEKDAGDTAADDAADETVEKPDSDGADVVSLDAFRKK